MNAEGKRNIKLERLGFSYERGGVHTARTMMLVELRALLSYVDTADAAKVNYLEAIQSANCLGKRSGKTRTLTFRHLADLYALDPNFLVFRALRFFWQRDVDGQPLLATLCAYSRDPILRATAPFVLGFQEGAIVTREAMEEFIDAQEPGRFSKATLKSTAQNINSSWTQSGHLVGRVRKVRTRAVATPGTVSLALLLGYVSGLRGESLFKSDFTRMLDCSFEKTIELAEDASRRGWISLKRVGQVVEALFPNLITAQEMELLREPN
ncbi:hypothetical protein [Pseudomonas helleri]|uniref:DUF1819 family protein n=1 Tax=Pseudomonas helleri TaxID=1608996 RepID=A0A7X1Y4V9_9PSED|nr:hypothetical protein [Pseudomonas helleri]MQT94910.1 hypothetical protein [Pseudomonas helleri]MQU30286.1 hypothetical protein [Pseudomonas helleri]